MDSENTVFIGKKNTMAYVLAVVTQLNSGKETVLVKARGKAIARAVDVAEIVRNRFGQGVSVGPVKISTEELESVDRQMIKVSAIEIVLQR
ncbi:MAG: DNA-binding protein Alba [Candidatus Micrarchaeota archaeon]